MNQQSSYCRLGVNIDHVATIRNARGHRHPEPLKAALLAVAAGADGITAHLREDRRHISDFDIAALREQLPVPLNLEMAATPEMLAIACKYRPKAVCLVPEKRQERTTEGGLDVVSLSPALASFVSTLGNYGMRVSLFIAPDVPQVMAAAALGVPVVEFHTGTYCDAPDEAVRQQELAKLQNAARIADDLGLECHAGHGLSYDTVPAIAAIPQIQELNIGHFLIGEAVFMGLHESVRRMRECIMGARNA